MTKSIGPEMLAAAAEKHGVNSKYANYAAKGAEKAGLKLKVPSLKDLISKPGAVAALLKTIMNFLKLRFPAFLGLNVLYSLALFGEPSFHTLDDITLHCSNADRDYQSCSLCAGIATNVVKRSDSKRNASSPRLKLQLLTRMTTFLSVLPQRHQQPLLSLEHLLETSNPACTSHKKLRVQGGPLSPRSTQKMGH